MKSSDPPLSAPLPGKKRRVLLFAAVLVLCSAIPNLPALRNGFTTLDDPRLIIDNPDIRGLSVDHVGKFFTRSYGGLGGYTPLVFLSYALEYRLFGPGPRAFHVTNLLLHVVDTLLVFWLFTLVGGGLGAGFITALLFAVHPLHVEPVAWIQGRKDLLFSMFYLAGLVFYVRSIRKGRGGADYAVSLLLFGLSLFSKVTAVSFPFVMLLLDKRFDRKIDRKAVVRTLPFWAMSGLFFVLVFMTHTSYFTQSARQPAGFGHYLSLFFYAFPFYAGKIFMLFGLYPGYSSDLGRHPWQILATIGVFIVVCGLLYLAYRRRPVVVTFGVGFALLTLLPTMPYLLFGQPYEDRYMYLPLAGLFFILAMLVSGEALDLRLPPRTALRVWPAIILVVAVFGACTWSQGRIWHDGISLWSHVIEKDPSNTVGYFNRADALLRGGRYPEALADYEKTERLIPHNPWVPQNKAAVYFEMGEFEKAMEQYDRSLSLDPLFHAGYMGRGTLWARLGEFRKAIADFSTALKLNKTFRGYYYRGLAYLKVDEPDKAISDLKSALALEPSQEVRDLLAKLASTNDPRE